MKVHIHPLWGGERHSSGWGCGIPTAEGHFAEILANWKVSQQTPSTSGSEGTLLSNLAKGGWNSVLIAAWESLGWEKSKWVLMDPWQLKPDNCKWKIKCFFAEGLINRMRRPSWETIDLRFLYIQLQRASFSIACFSQIQVIVNNGGKTRGNWIIFLCWRSPRRHESAIQWEAPLRKQYKKDSLKHGLSFSGRKITPKSHLVLPAVLANPDLTRGTALPFSSCVRIFVVTAQEFSVIAWCFNASLAEVGVLPSWFFLLSLRAEQACEQP